MAWQMTAWACRRREAGQHPMHLVVVDEGEHRALAAYEQDGVEVVDGDLAQWCGRLDQCGVGW